jgi:hypothetical protein
MVLDINTDGIVVYTNKLEQIHKSALPVAVRAALNGAAFDVKKNTMPEEAAHAFIQRKKNFFKANSTVQPAKGFSIEKMEAVVGFKSRTGTADQAVEDLEQQEHGGTIGERDFIGLKGSRKSGSWEQEVKANLRLGNLKNLNIVNADKVRFKNHGKRKAQKFIRAAIIAKKNYGKNAFVLGNKWGGGNRTLSRIDSITMGDGRVTFERTPLYTYRPNRKVDVARKNFMKRASLESGLTIEKRFVNEAIKQLKKYTGR